MNTLVKMFLDEQVSHKATATGAKSTICDVIIQHLELRSNDATLHSCIIY